jgi:hypothetical protein
MIATSSTVTHADNTLQKIATGQLIYPSSSRLGAASVDSSRCSECVRATG